MIPGDVVFFPGKVDGGTIAECLVLPWCLLTGETLRKKTTITCNNVRACLYDDERARTAATIPSRDVHAIDDTATRTKVPADGHTTDWIADSGRTS